MHWLKRLKASLPIGKRGWQARVRFNEPLSNHTTLRIGGPAQVWVEPKDIEQLRQILCCCVKEQIPYLVVGRGSNILFSERGFRGVVICLNSRAFTKMEIKTQAQISCGAGLDLSKLINQAQKRGLGGLEFLAGIPATAGGALIMNAGNTKDNIASLIESVTVMDRRGVTRVLKKKQLIFGYRRSNLDRYIVLEAQLRLTRSSPKKVKKQILENLSKKRETQDLSARSAGCIFKNPRYGLAAGQMLEACGLKRRRRRGAEISAKHANYIINRNSAQACDILYLINLAQGEVRKKFGVLLEPEIKIIK